MRQNMDQRRAQFALTQVGQIQKQADADKMKVEATRLAAMIMTSGFLQAMDYALLKKLTCFEPLQKWFAQNQEQGPAVSQEMRNAAQQEKLTDHLANNADLNEFRHALEEAMSFLGWLKSKAEGRAMELPKDSPEDPEKKEETVT